jgi:regulatory protein
VKKRMDNLLQKAKDDAFNLLSYRERSQAELEERLVRKGYSVQIIAEVISTLKDLNYLDDRRFARKWIKDRIRNRPRGRYVLELELGKKGIDERIIKESLADLLSEEKELELALRVARKWIKIYPQKQDDNMIKLKKHLQNKGFSLDILNKAISNLR